MPPPPRTGGPPVTNIRNTSSLHWRSIWIARGHSLASWKQKRNPSRAERWPQSRPVPAYIRPCAGLSNNHRSRKPSRAVLLVRLDALEVETTQTSEDREAATDCIDAATPDLSTRRSRTVLSWIAFGFQIELSGSSMFDSDFRKSAPKLCANWRRRRPIPFIKRRLLALISRYHDSVSARAPLMPKFQSQGTGSEQ